MYEYEKASGGMGWSDYLPGGEFQTCSHVVGGVKKCFTNASSDRRCAENSGCFELRDESCQTTSGGSGNLWCCPRHLPPPPGNPCVQQSVDMVCLRSDARCSDFRNERQCGVCQIQKALCDLGIDSGPIDGRGISDMYRLAVQMFQARNGLDVTGVVTPAVIERLNLQSTCAAAAIGEGPVGPGVGLPAGVTDYFWPIAFSLSSVFLGVAWWKYGRRGR